MSPVVTLQPDGSALVHAVHVPVLVKAGRWRVTGGRFFVWVMGGWCHCAVQVLPKLSELAP